ncbi:aldehyde dehydrogenase [Mycolicibacterium mageritense DSM 44476 = CIP 104973]|uniref:Aldehyde dehydrogenase n=1 Tax=Mycolicibacterium mageritense TaxID=53462 RepID=A0ABM7HVI4_MYCME|nr:aldehyde dehydrogenase [Mycolicibacterium mageritense]MCC9181568.1 aldehyde dehydrogenase [Mycolicibacterium mageritense]BBX34616.1 aldehyde dehydrogenase [Mycolicibacterium mageritense]CDO20865.1 5-carboxymethyl-2-hydroxymuconate semialdehyde dehydrogenase [Mycolicibacterium mageritense DSM 44476 = CIP 104973]
MTTTITALAQPRSYIAGEWVDCDALDAWNIDPNTGEPVHRMMTTTTTDLERALQHAQRAYDAADFTSEEFRLERADALERAATKVEDRLEEIARTDAITSGTAITSTRKLAAFLPPRIRAAAAEARRIPRVTALAAGGRDVRLHRVPWGPAAILTPWNGPSFIPAAKIASAIAAGCPVLLKPSEHAPASAQVIAECFVDAGLPDGALQLVHGTGGIGAALTADRRVQVVSFTGGPGAGRAIARAAAEDFKVLQLELGGNNPVLVLDDADLDVTADGILAGMTTLNGQWCEGPGKVLAPHRLVQPLRQALIERITRLRIGHSLDEGTDIGPISNEPHYRTLLQRIDDLRGLGAEIDQPGELPGLAGYFLSPTIATGSDPDRTTAELFGPVISLHGVGSDEEALHAANAHPSGLDAYVFGTDTDRAIAVGARIKSGEVRVNGAKLADLGDGSAQSFWGRSGIGGHGPAESVRVFCGERVVGVDSPDLPL